MTMIQCKQVLLSNGEMLGYRERSGGEDLLLLIHGNMTSSKHWDVLMEKLDPKYHLIAVDLRGFGMSSYHQRIDSLKDFSEDIKQFVDALSLKSFSLMGWSTGGGVAMQFTADHPEYVQKLVLLASASTRGYPFVELDPVTGQSLQRLTTRDDIANDRLKTMPVLQAIESKNKEFLQWMWNSLIYTQQQPSVEHYDEYLEDMLTQRNLVDVYHALNVFNISSHHNGLSQGTEDVEKIQVSTLVLWGENDLVVTETMTNEIMEDLKEQARLVILKNCGHSPLIDDCAQLKNQIEQFLQ
ncbi:alpha/beta fold hydrolase [Hazenella coriacea]|uniref:Pimeloyl-ACP methyl ester carboxylesterase n=1 Tax=Hazenella coriacea TaxID=1179467 RepID=A0A4R3L2N8_9BACL|nr:alpha/beta hydrolase [Hazenella coriacea]TCS93911.1 pimeloyl-ACP methyl ester carboxylesterase [Hazenella coriacea]